MPHTDNSFPLASEMEEKNSHSIRWQHTHNALRTTYIELIDELGPDNVTVSSITARAHVHRKTFYLHYESLEALYDERVTELANQFGQMIATMPRPLNYYDLSRAMFTFYSSSPELERIFSSARFRQLADAVVVQSTRISRSAYNPFRFFTEAEQELINTFVVYSSVNVWRRWYASGKQVPQDKAIQLLGDLLEHGVKDMRAPYEKELDSFCE